MLLSCFGICVPFLRLSVAYNKTNKRFIVRDEEINVSISKPRKWDGLLRFEE